MNHFENRVLLKPVLRGLASVAHLSNGHEQAQHNRVCYFHLFCAFIASEGPNYSELLLHIYTVKILKFGTPQTIAITVLKIEKFDVTLH